MFPAANEQRYCQVSQGSGSRWSRLVRRYEDWKDDADPRLFHAILDLAGMAIVVAVLWWTLSAVSG